MYKSVDHRKPEYGNLKKNKYYTKSDIQKLENAKSKKVQQDHGIFNEINGSIEDKVLLINDKLEQRGLHNKNNFSRLIETDMTNMTSNTQLNDSS